MPPRVRATRSRANAVKSVKCSKNGNSVDLESSRRDTQITSESQETWLKSHFCQSAWHVAKSFGGGVTGGKFIPGRSHSGTTVSILSTWNYTLIFISDLCQIMLGRRKSLCACQLVRVWTSETKSDKTRGYYQIKGIDNGKTLQNGPYINRYFEWAAIFKRRDIHILYDRKFIML